MDAITDIIGDETPKKTRTKKLEDESTWIDFDHVMKAGSPALVRTRAETAAREALSTHGRLPLGHIMQYRHAGGQIIIEEIDNAIKANTLDYGDLGTYRFRCVKMPVWRGNLTEPKSGDIYFYKRGVKLEFVDPRTQHKTPMTTRHLDLMRRKCKKRGDEFDSVVWADKQLDKNLEFSVGYFDAIYLLSTVTEHNFDLPSERIELEYVG